MHKDSTYRHIAYFRKWEQQPGIMGSYMYKSALGSVLVLSQNGAGRHFRCGGSIGKVHLRRFSEWSPEIAMSELTTRAQTNCVLSFLLYLAMMTTFPKKEIVQAERVRLQRFSNLGKHSAPVLNQSRTRSLHYWQYCRFWRWHIVGTGPEA